MHVYVTSPPISQSLQQLLEPVNSVLTSACTRPYLSTHTITSSLLTLNSLISTFLSGSALNSDLWQGESLGNSVCYHGNDTGGRSETGRLIFKTLLPWLPDVVQSVQVLMLRGSLDGRPSLHHLSLLTSSLSSLHTLSSLYGFSWTGDISPAHLTSSALDTLKSVLLSNDKV